MIAYVSGLLAEKEPGRVVVEAGGIGYELFVSLSAYDTLPREGGAVKLLAWHCVRDDGEALYGFSSKGERDMFLKLVSVGGVGPKLAMTILSGAATGELALAISGGNAKRLSAIKGVGRKTAEKICVELKDKIDAVEALAAGSRGRGGAAAGNTLAPVLHDAILALGALGFAPETASKMVSAAVDAAGETAGVEEIVRTALALGAGKAGGK